MKFLKSAFCLRTASRVHTRLALRDERNVSSVLIPVISPIFWSFSVVDWVATGFRHFFLFLILRVIATSISAGLYYYLRGRSRYGLRFFCTLAPYIFVIQFNMIFFGLGTGSYFAGLCLVLFSGTLMFPFKIRVGALVYGITMSPAIVYYLTSFYVNHDPASLVALTMSLGTVILVTANSVAARKEVEGRILASETLAYDLKNRKKEIASKALELIRAKRLEGQFSPEIAKLIMEKSSLMNEMQRHRIITIVADMKDSTKKATELEPRKYAEVIREMFDIVTASCTKYGVSLEKFTGDGAQAFVGYPGNKTTDLQRSLSFALRILEQVAERNPFLSGLWGEPVVMRIGICEGDALIGQLGSGSIQAFTAIGESVSFTHRLSGAAESDSILMYSYYRNEHLDRDVGVGGFTVKNSEVSGLKGFEGRRFKVLGFKPTSEDLVTTANHLCPACGSVMVLEETAMGIPHLVCKADHAKKAA